MVFPYLDKTELKNELPYKGADFDIDDSGGSPTDWDDLLDRLLEQESNRVEEYADTAFETRTTTETLDGTGTDELPLDDRPVQSITTLDVRDADGTTHDLSADVWVYETHVLIKDDADLALFPNLPQNVTVEYDWGHASASISDVPDEVQEAVLRLVRKRLSMIEEDGLKQESVGDMQASYVPPRELRREVYNSVQQFNPPSYSGGIEVI